MQLLRISFFLSIMLLVFMAKSSYAEIILNEDAVEADQITVVGSKTNGFVLVKKCDTCPQLRLQLSPNTKAFFNGKEVPFSNVPSKAKNAITVIYDPKINTVNKIVW